MVYFHHERLAERIVSVYRELPAMRLTATQAAKLFSIPAHELEPVLKLLVVDGRLQLTADGCFAAPPRERRRRGMTRRRPSHAHHHSRPSSRSRPARPGPASPGERVRPVHGARRGSHHRRASDRRPLSAGFSR